jgi:hypothetical protein
MKRTVIIGVSTMIIGLICFALGLGNGGNRPVYWDHGLSVESSSRSVDKTPHSQQFNKVKRIKLTAAHAVKIQRGDVSSVHVDYHGKTKVTQTGSQLVVAGPQVHTRWRIAIFGGSGGFEAVAPKTAGTVITIPKSTKLDAIDAHSDEDGHNDNDDYFNLTGLTVGKVSYSGDGDLSIQRVHVTDTLTTSGIGDVSLSKSRFDKANLSSDVGDVDLKSNTFNKLDIKSDTGDISFNPQVIKQSFRAYSDVGDIDGRIYVDKRTHVTLNTDVGDKSLFGHSNSEYGLDNGSHSVNYRFSSDVGDITINKAS